MSKWKYVKGFEPSYTQKEYETPSIKSDFRTVTSKKIPELKKEGEDAWAQRENQNTEILSAFEGKRLKSKRLIAQAKNLSTKENKEKK